MLGKKSVRAACSNNKLELSYFKPCNLSWSLGFSKIQQKICRSHETAKSWILLYFKFYKLLIFVALKSEVNRYTVISYDTGVSFMLMSFTWEQYVQTFLWLHLMVRSEWFWVQHPGLVARILFLVLLISLLVFSVLCWDWLFLLYISSLEKGKIRNRLSKCCIIYLKGGNTVL